MGDLGVVDLDTVNMRVVDIGMIVAGVVELVVGELEVIGLVVGVVGEDCLREMEMLNENYLMKVEVVAEGCLLDGPTRFGAYHRRGFDHQF